MNQSIGVNISVPMCPMSSHTAVILHVLVYAILLCFALVGNILVIFVIYQNKKMRTTVNYFIVNMSLSDLMIPIVIIPKQMLKIATRSEAWTVHGAFGELLCKFFFYMIDITPSVSVLSLVFMTVDRFYAVFFPMKAAITSKTYRLGLIIITWVIPMVFFSPYFKNLELMPYATQYYCEFTWSVSSHIKFATATCIIFVVIPFALLIALYGSILAKLRGRKITGEEMEQQKKRREKTNIAVIKLAFAVILAFALCWGPYNTVVFIYSFVWRFRVPAELICTMETVMYIVYFLAYSNSAINPLIYFILNKNYREGLKRTLTRSSNQQRSQWGPKTLQVHVSDDRSFCMESLQRPLCTHQKEDSTEL